MICSIYRITNIINNKVYVGQTWKLLHQRLVEHSNKKGSIKLHNAIKKYGVGNFTIELITFAHTQTVADYWEIYFIQQYQSIQSGYNITEGGSGSHGFKHSSEHKKRMSEIMTGANNPRFGLPGTMLGHAMTDVSKQKLSEFRANQTMTTETKKKISNSISGENHPGAKLTKQNVIDIKNMLRNNINYRIIAKMFNVTPNSIFLIKIGKTWKNITF